MKILHASVTETDGGTCWVYLTYDVVSPFPNRKDKLVVKFEAPKASVRQYVNEKLGIEISNYVKL